MNHKDLFPIKDYQTFKLESKYEIDSELIARKILEQNTSYKIIFDKNEDPYGFDIMSWRYLIYEGGKYEKEFLGYIEIEHSPNWISFDPPLKETGKGNWYCVSFLKRKVCTFDRNKNEWAGEKDNLNYTYYLKFNRHFTNCVCARADLILRNGTESGRNKMNRNLTAFKDSYLELNPHEVVWGIKESISMIEMGFEKI